MKHYKIEIKVAYDEATVSDSETLRKDLRWMVDHAIQRGMLTPDDDGLSGGVVIDDLKVTVKEVS